MSDQITERGDPRDRITNQLPLPPSRMRRLTCTRCGTVWPVFEEPVEFIDPALYVCPDCMRPVEGQRTLDLPEPVTVQYDPAVSRWPEGF